MPKPFKLHFSMGSAESGLSGVLLRSMSSFQTVICSWRSENTSEAKVAQTL